MKTVKLKLLLLLLAFFSVSCFAKEKQERTSANNSGFLYGMGFNANKEIYKGYSTRKMLIPLLGYKGENLTVYGPFVSYKIKEFNHVKVTLKLSPRFQGFDQSDSTVFSGMKERKNSIDIGVGVDYKKNDWKLAFSTMFDGLNKSNGFELKSVIGHVFRFGPVFIEPYISLSYLDRNHVDYYYGVLDFEANQTRATYTGESALNKSIGLSVATPVFLGGYTRLSVNYTSFDKRIANSPLVDDDKSVSLGIFFTKHF